MQNNPWEFGWMAIAALGQILVGGIAVFLALWPTHKHYKIFINLYTLYPEKEKFLTATIVNIGQCRIVINSSGISLTKRLFLADVGQDHYPEIHDLLPKTIESSECINRSFRLDSLAETLEQDLNKGKLNGGEELAIYFDTSDGKRYKKKSGWTVKRVIKEGRK
jgi:hypothetical protein